MPVYRSAYLRVLPPPPREEEPPDERIELLPEDIPLERIVELPPEERTAELLVVRILGLLLERIDGVFAERLTAGVDAVREAVDTAEVLFTTDVERTGVAAASLGRREAGDTAPLRNDVLVVRVVTVCVRVAASLRTAVAVATREAVLRLAGATAGRLFTRTLVLPKIRFEVLREDTRVDIVLFTDELRTAFALRTVI